MMRPRPINLRDCGRFRSRLIRFGLPLLLVLWALLAGGCATRPLPLGDPLAGVERLAVEAGLVEGMEQRRRAFSCLDAEVRLQWQTMLRSGVLPGYLQLLRPGHLQFVGLDPLGRPLLALLTDGDFFRLVLVGEAKAYEGPTAAEVFQRYLPVGLRAEDLADSLFSWLSGELPPGARIAAVHYEQEGPGYWLELVEPPGVRLLFRAGVLHQVRFDEPGQRQPAEIFYHDYRPLPFNDAGGAALSGAEAAILLPHRVELRSGRHQGLNLSISLDDPLADCGLVPADFQLPIPRGFAVEPVQ